MLLRYFFLRNTGVSANGAAGEYLARALRNDSQTLFQQVFFYDQRRQKLENLILGAAGLQNQAMLECFL